MAKHSKIEWTHHTFNPWWGCERVSAACKNCYAEQWAHRLGLDLWSKDSPRRTLSDAYWRQPIAWNRQAGVARRRDRVFCASMADVFEDRRELDALRARLWGLISETPHLDWLLLTKRPECVVNMVPWGNVWPHNVWLGTTVETQRWADRRIPVLLRQPAAVLFLSCEPLLGPIDLSRWFVKADGDRRIDWVISGGESGPRARPMNPGWVRALRNQCRAHRVPFHFKQWGNWRPVDGHIDGYRARNLEDKNGIPIVMVNMGKKAAGRILDGRKWDELPSVA